MTTWIGTNQTGWDTQSIGFHSLNGCTAFVVSTDDWVAGWHIGGGAGGDYGGSGQTKVAFQGSAFMAYIRQINPNPWPAVGLPGGNIGLYVVHLGQTDWQATLADFAALLGYHGPASGLDLKPHVGTDSCDAVITKVGGVCQIEYKRTSKMNHVKQTDHQFGATVVKTVRGTLNDLVRTQDLWNKESATATVKQTFFNKGLMHRAAAKLFVQVAV